MTGLSKFVCLFVLLSNSAYSFDINSNKSIDVDKNMVTMEGVDVLSYSDSERHYNGSPNFTSIYDNAIYYFKDTLNRNKFNKNPGYYIPAFGAFCSWAAAHGKKVHGDPDAYRIKNKQLYVFYDEDAAKKWDEDPEKYISLANSYWMKIKNKSPKELEQ